MIGYLRSVDQFGEFNSASVTPQAPLICSAYESLPGDKAVYGLIWSLMHAVDIIWLSHDSLSTANLLLQDTIERIHVGKQFGDIPRGIYLIRGENVALCGEIVS